MRRIEAFFPETGPMMIGLAYLGLTNGPSAGAGALMLTRVKTQ